MSLLSVFVEGAKDPSQHGVKRLAGLIASRYGLSASDLEKRFSTGRFRVKANVDEATASAFAADLEGLGARCSISTAATTRPPPAASASPPSTEPPTALGPPATTRSTSPPSEPPATARAPSSSARAARRTGSSLSADAPPMSRTMTLPMAGMPVRPAASGGAPSGLAAALADATYQPGGLGALETSTFSLAPLDGRDSQAPLSRSGPQPLTFDPTTVPEPESPAVPPASSEAARPAIDLFAPPSEGQELAVDLVEEVRPRRGSMAPEVLISPGRPARPGQPGLEGAPMMAPAIAAHSRAAARGATSLPHHQRVRIQLAAGVLLAVLLGFVPVHVMASRRESAAFEKIDNRVRASQSEIASMAEWNALDDIRAARFRQKVAAHQEIAFLSVLLWIAISGGLSLGWVYLVMPRLAH